MEDLIAANPDLVDLADAGEVAAYLQARDMVVVCGPGIQMIEEATGGEPTDPSPAEAVQADGIPAENAVPTESPVREGKI
ncbi:hypothetical protein [Actinoplanes utahensis]|uniref:hypothetical protein n=1 Tax=Actinoplanes utahensis TaxID=1869 RepID=UPI000A9AC820|nr:hypothetical protein [Actinoplanes utahensis]